MLLSDIIGYYSWNWGTGSTGPPNANHGVAFTGLVDVAQAQSGYTPGAAWCCPELKGTRWLSLGGGNSAGMFSKETLNKIVDDAPAINASAYDGVMFDVEEVVGPASVMVGAFGDAFAAVKARGLLVGVTTSHSAPYATDAPADAVAFVRAWAADGRIDVLSPQLYSSGSEAAPELAPTAACAAAGCTWELYRGAKPAIAPSIVDASQYAAAQAFFAANISVKLAGFFEWKQEKRGVGQEKTAAAAEARPEAWTLDGLPLYPPTFTGLAKEALDAQLQIARDNLAGDGGPQQQVWLGRRLAYKWEYREAVAAFTAALAAAPDDAPLHRHRGHRLITERNFSKAQADLERAAALCPAGAADEWEEDGEPNAYNLPLSTKGFNIAYHLGLSRFLQADWAGALKAYDAPPMPTSLNDESAAAVAHWSWMASMRLGDRVRANASLAKVHAGMRALDGGAYLNLTLMYKGERTPDEVLGGTPSDLDLATLGFGVGTYHLVVRGDRAAALAVWRRVTQTSYWAAFGYIAAEAELHRAGEGGGRRPDGARAAPPGRGRALQI